VIGEACIVYLLLAAALCTWLMQGWLAALVAFGLASLALLLPLWLLRR
jgi:hypothetical protein